MVAKLKLKVFKFQLCNHSTISLFDDTTALFDDHRGTLVGPLALPLFYFKPPWADKPTKGKLLGVRVF